VRKKMETAPLTYCHTFEGECQELDTEVFTLKARNMSDLLRIQEVINTMDGRTYSLDQVIERIIGFYGRYVPF